MDANQPTPPGFEAEAAKVAAALEGVHEAVTGPKKRGRPKKTEAAQPTQTEMPLEAPTTAAKAPEKKKPAPRKPSAKKPTKKQLAEAAAADDRNYDHTGIITDIDEAIDALAECDEIGLDLETGGLNPHTDPIAVFSMKGNNGKVAILHVRGAVPERLRAFLNEPRLFVIHNGTVFDIPFLKANGINPKRWFDTLTVESLIQTSGRKDVSRSLKATVARRLGRDVPKSIGEHSWMKPSLTGQEIQYCRDDVEHLVPLMYSHIQKAKESGQLNALKLELAIMPAVTAMVMNGLPVSRPHLTEYLGIQGEKASTNRAALAEIWPGVNVDSHAQLKKAYKEMGVDLPKKRNKQGEMVVTTDIEALTEVSTNHEDAEVRRITQLLIDYRYGGQRIKMYGGWLKPDCPMIYNGRVRAKFWQTGTGTLRFSSSEPNLQQVPKDMRNVFGWEPGMMVLSLDYAAIEVRVAAAQARDRELLLALQSEDTHYAVASMLFGKPISEITDDERQQAKAAVFCLIFGGGAGTLQRYARMYKQYLTLDECRNIVKRFFDRFTGLAAMRSRAYAQADNRPGGPLVIKFPHGAKRVLVGADAKATSLLNTSVQGTAAAGLKYALKMAHDRGLTAYLGAVVHDEMVATVPEDKVDWYIREMKECMIEGMYQVVPRSVMVEGEMIPVPIEVGVATPAPSWKELK